MALKAVAWVPDDDPQRDWSIAAGLATRWIEERCREEGATGLLVTNALNHLGVPELDVFAQRHTRTSRLAKRDRVGPGTGPVLSYVPDADDLHFAMGLARKSSLAVVEGSLFPLSGWAAWFEAWNLVANEPTPPLPKKITEAVERLAFHGNNGFGDAFGKQQALSILDRVRDQEDFEENLILGAVLAAGVRPRGVKNLASLISKTL